MTSNSVDDLRSDLEALLADEVLAEDEEFEPDTDLLRSGLMDSLSVVQVVDWLEARYAVEIDPADVTLEHFRSIDAIVAYVERRIGGSAR